MIYAKEKRPGGRLKDSRAGSRQGYRSSVVYRRCLAPWGDVFIRIRQQSWESTSNAAEINRLLEWLARIDNFDWIPPTVLYLHFYRNDATRVTHFLRRMERLAASMYIRRSGINPRIDRYALLLSEIHDHWDMLPYGSALDHQRQRARGRARSPRRRGLPRQATPLRSPAPGRPKSAGGASYDHKIITVEHVLPQNPNPDSKWVKVFDAEARAKWTHRLGNLVLLPRRKNRRGAELRLRPQEEQVLRWV